MALFAPRRLYTICLLLAVGEVVLSGAVVAGTALVDTKKLWWFWHISLTIATLLTFRSFSGMALMTKCWSQQRVELFSRPYLLFYFYGATLSFLALVGYAWTELLFVIAALEHDSSLELQKKWQEVVCAALNCFLSGLWVAICCTPWMAMPRKIPRPKMATFKFGLSRSQEQALPETLCVICMEDFEFGQMVGMLPCGHACHRDCICRWFDSGSGRCPMRCDRRGSASSPRAGVFSARAGAFSPRAFSPRAGAFFPRLGAREERAPATAQESNHAEWDIALDIDE